MSIEPQPIAAITDIYVFLTLEPTAQPLFHADSGMYDPNTGTLTVTSVGGGTGPGAIPILGKVYGIVFNRSVIQVIDGVPTPVNIQTMIHGRLLGSTGVETSDAWLQFKETYSYYNHLTWLFCHRLAADDFMWSVECPIECLVSLLIHPVEWVDGLNRIAGPCSNTPAQTASGTLQSPPLRLQSPFTIQMSLDANQTVGSGRVRIEGISETGILRVILSATGVNPLVDTVTQMLRNIANANLGGLPAPLVEGTTAAEYWTCVYNFLQSENDKPTILIDSVTGRAFGHLKIFDAGKRKFLEGVSFINKDFNSIRNSVPFIGEDTDFIERSIWIATYLVARLLDPSAYATFLNTFDWIVTNTANQSAPFLGSVQFQSGPNASFTYASERTRPMSAATFSSGPSPDRLRQP